MLGIGVEFQPFLRPEPQQPERHGLQVVQQLHPLNTGRGGQGAFLDQPGQVGDARGAVEHRAGHAEAGGFQRHALIAQKLGNDIVQRSVVSAGEQPFAHPFQTFGALFVLGEDGLGSAYVTG